MDWSAIAPHFRKNGWLRDIYILDASFDDWQRVWDFLRSGRHPLEYQIDGEPAEPPADVRDIFEIRRTHSARACCVLGKQRLNCNFFDEREIEFDLVSQAVDSPIEAERLEKFLIELGHATLKEVRLTHLDEPDEIIARYDEEMDFVSWTPFAAYLRDLDRSGL